MRLRTQGHSLGVICNLVGISRQAYHKRLARQKTKSDLYQQAEQVVIMNRKIKSRSGLRTIYYKEHLSSLLGVNQFEKEMSARGFALKPYRSFIKTTDSRGHHYKFENLVAGADITSENQLIVGDITYYQGASGLYYIFQFQDFYTLEVKGLVGSNNMEGTNAIKCLRQVFDYNKKTKYNHYLVLHTDAGSQYRSHRFQDLLHNAQIRPSHARNCFENGLSERTNGIIKNEYLIDYQIKNTKHLNAVLKKIKHQVNNQWPSQRLGYITPHAFAKSIRTMKPEDRPVKKVKEVDPK
jgi:transposase InsO family protein